MDSDVPLISIVLPTFNVSTYLPSCLESLLRQSYKNIEIIAIDDASTDNSYAILRGFRKKDKRLRVYRNVKRYGMATTLNRCINKAKGSLIAFMDAHDKAMLKRIEAQAKYLINNPKIAAVGSQVGFVGPTNRKSGESAFPTDHETIYEQLIHGLSMQFETIMIHRLRLPKDMLKFRINLYPFIFADLMVRLSHYGHVANLPQVLYYRRMQARSHAKTLGTINHSLYVLRMWLRSFSQPGTTPSLRSVITPLLRA